MKVIHIYYQNISAKVEDLSLILGYFDGVHLGHHYLIKEARKHAKHPLAILTFDKPVSALVDNGKSPELLTSLDDRFRIISKLGIDFYYLFHIDKEFLSLSDVDFIELLRKLNVREVFVGEDYRFAKNRSGNVDTLKDYFDVHVIDLLKENGEKISSQEIKVLLEKGMIEEANKLLGHNYQINGTFVSGKHIGHKLGFPTLNVKMNDNYCLPRFGVYKTIAYLDGIPHLSITNVGVKPTVDAGNIPNIEVHVKDYEEKNYSTIAVEFVEFIRPEMKFANLEELRKQIESDVKKVFKNQFANQSFFIIIINATQSKISEHSDANHGLSQVLMQEG